MRLVKQKGVSIWLRRGAGGYIVVMLMFVGFIACVSVQVAAASAELTQSYRASTDVVPGSLVSLEKADNENVVLAGIKNSERLIGVSVAPKGSTIALNASSATTQVATSGRVIALVSTINGDIQTGDLLSVSAIQGVAAKLTKGSRAIGVAQQAFNKNTTSAQEKKVVDRQGNPNDVAFGAIPIVVALGAQPATVRTLNSTGIAGWAESIAGKPVSRLRLALSGVVAVIMITTMAVLVYGSVHSTVYGVSRNPLAKSYVFEALSEVLFMVMIIAVLGTVLMYALLRV